MAKCFGTICLTKNPDGSYSGTFTADGSAVTVTPFRIPGQWVLSNQGHTQVSDDGNDPCLPTWTNFPFSCGYQTVTASVDPACCSSSSSSSSSASSLSSTSSVSSVSSSSLCSLGPCIMATIQGTSSRSSSSSSSSSIIDCCLLLYSVTVTVPSAPSNQGCTGCDNWVGVYHCDWTGGCCYSTNGPVLSCGANATPTPTTVEACINPDGTVDVTWSITGGEDMVTYESSIPWADCASALTCFRMGLPVDPTGSCQLFPATVTVTN